MRTVVQRVSEAAVAVDGQVVGRIDRGPGLLIFVGFEADDEAADLDWMAQKLIRLRIFADGEGVMNLGIVDVGGQILAISQFTLYVSVTKGNRPSWSRAAHADVSQPLFERFVERLSKALGRPVQTGSFGADMQVSLINDGPVTIVIDSKNPE